MIQINSAHSVFKDKEKYNTLQKMYIKIHCFQVKSREANLLLKNSLQDARAVTCKPSISYFGLFLDLQNFISFYRISGIEGVSSRQCTHSQFRSQHPHPVDHKLPTCSFNYFPNSTGSGRYERMLIKAESSNIDNMKSIYILFRGNSIAYCSLIHMI